MSDRSSLPLVGHYYKSPYSYRTYICTKQGEWWWEGKVIKLDMKSNNIYEVGDIVRLSVYEINKFEYLGPSEKETKKINLYSRRG